MINTPAIANLIRERKISQIYSQLQTGSKEGMNTLEQCLENLVDQGEISQKKHSAKHPIPKHCLAMMAKHDSVRNDTKPAESR